MSKKHTKVKMDANPTKISWPTDKWGFTRELRKAVIGAASKLKGDPDKKRILDETIEVAIEFLEVNFASSVRDRKRAIDKLAAKEAAALKEPTRIKEPFDDEGEPEFFDLFEEEE